jgi:hypothetical protein
VSEATVASGIDKTVFLLGAGASVDAGMPAVQTLTAELRDGLPYLRDVNGRLRPEFREIFGVLAKHDPEVSDSYERFFEWIHLIGEAQRTPFRTIVRVGLTPKLKKAAAELPFVIGGAVKELLLRKRRRPDYLAKLADFIPTRGRLKVFTLNYDCCVEEACRKADVALTTGFDRRSREWRPSLFSGKERGINLYKLHGSLCWFLDMKSVCDKGPNVFVEVASLRQAERRIGARQAREPELTLGPGSKLQADDPFLTLFYEFSRAMARARVCVVVGFGYKDEHVKQALDKVAARGTRIIDVNPGDPCGRYLADNYCHLKMGAKQALLSGVLLKEVQRSVS